MDAEEKEKQILSTQETKDGLTPEQEAGIFFPEEATVTIKDREYVVASLKLKQMKLLLKLSKIDLKTISESSIDLLTDGFSEILQEPDKEFLEENLDIALIREIMLKVRQQTYAGIPIQKKVAPTGN